MTGFFDEITHTNAAYCASLGIDTNHTEHAEAVADEVKWLMARGMPAEKAIRWAPVNVLTGVSNKPRAIVEYAYSQADVDQANERFAEALGKYYDDCRRRYGGGVCWVGD